MHLTQKNPVGNICCITRDSLFIARKGLAITNKGKVWKYPQDSSIQRHKEREKWISGRCVNLLKIHRQFTPYAPLQGQCSADQCLKGSIRILNIMSSMPSSYPTSVLCTWKGLDPQLRCSEDAKSSSSLRGCIQHFSLLSGRAMHFSTFSILQCAIPWRPQPARVPAGSTWPFKTYMPLKVCLCMLLPNF